MRPPPTWARTVSLPVIEPTRCSVTPAWRTLTWPSPKSRPYSTLANDERLTRGTWLARVKPTTAPTGLPITKLAVPIQLAGSSRRLCAPPFQPKCQS